MVKDEIAVGIVVYNPNNERFKDCLSSILNQVGKLYIFDNGDVEYTHILSDKIDYRSEKENKGLSYALNQLMEMAKQDGFEWLVTMDQDSIIPKNLINAYKRKIREGDNVGIICPQIIDKRRAYMVEKTQPMEEYVEFCITSGSCTSIKCWETVGKFDEWLFIDLIDNDFCKRVVTSGYKILRLNDQILNQEFGTIVPKNKKKQEFWIKVSKIFHNPNFAKFSYYKYVNPIRVYYTSRNIIYVNRKLKKYGAVGYKENYNCKGYIGFLISFCIPSIIRAQKKVKVLRAVAQGIRDGIKAEVIEWKK